MAPHLARLARFTRLVALAFLASGAACGAPEGGSPALPSTSSSPVSASSSSSSALAGSPARAPCAPPAPRGAPVLVAQSGLHGYGQAIAYSPDGAMVAVGDQSSSIRVFDPRTGEVRALLRGHTERVNGLAFNPAGDRLVSTSVDQTTRLWDLATGKSQAIAAAGARVYSVIWSPDGQTIATQHDSFVRLLSLTGKLKGELPAPTAGSRFNPDGSAIVTWQRGFASSMEIVVWDTTTGAARFRVPFGKGGSSAAAFSPDGKTIAWVQGETVSLADPKTGVVRATFLATGAFGGTFSWSPDGKRLAIGGASDGAQLWDPVARTRVAVLDKVSRETFTWSPDGAFLAASKGTGVEVYDAATGQSRATLQGNKDRVWPLVWSPDGKTLAGASGVQDPSMLFWDTATWTRREAQKQPYRTRRFAWSPDGKAMISVGSSGGSSWEMAARIWDAGTGALRATLRDPGTDRGFSDGYHDVAWSPDGARIAIAGMDNVTLWDAATTRRIAELDHDYDYHSEHAIAWSPDGRTLATSGGKSAEIRLWNGATGARVRVVPSGLPHVWSFAWSPDGATLAVGERGKIRLFETAGWTELRTLTGAFRGVFDMAFAPDGRTLLAGGEDGHVFAFNPATTSQLANLAAHSNRLRSLSVSPDGSGFVTSGEDRRVLAWDLKRFQLIGEMPVEGDDSPDCVGFSPDGEVLAIARGPLQLYRLRDGAGALLRPVVVGGELLGLATADSGLFSGDAGALSALRFRDGPELRSGSLHGAAEVADKLSRPRVLADLIAGCPTTSP